MKIRRLSEIDLAHFVSIEKDEPLKRALRGYNSGGGSWSYDPVRGSTSDILDARTPLYGPLEPVSWPKIQRQIERACTRGAAQQSANTEVGKVLFDAARVRDWRAIAQTMGRLPIGRGETVRYWSDVVIVEKDSLFIPFFDHRRGQGITTPSMRRVVYSMQHIWVRERNFDLAAARLAIIQFPCVGVSDKEERQIKVHFCDEGDLLSYEELDRRVRHVYEIWALVSSEKSGDERGTGTDDSGGLL